MHGDHSGVTWGGVTGPARTATTGATRAPTSTNMLRVNTLRVRTTSVRTAGRS